MAFDSVRLPDFVERGASGGPRFKTTVLTLSSGFERRNSDWSQTRGEWDVGYGIQSVKPLREVINFFYARNGRARAFRFKDWTDYQLERQSIGQTDTTTNTFQVFRRYESGAVGFNRILTKIVAGTVSVWVNDVAINEGPGADEYQIDVETGIVTLGGTLSGQDGTEVEVACEFDVPVRFANDALDITADLADVVGILQIPIIEIRT